MWRPKCAVVPAARAIDTATPPAVSVTMRVTAAIGGSVCVVLGLIGAADAAPPTRRALYLAGELAELRRAADAAPVAARVEIGRAHV